MSGPAEWRSAAEMRRQSPGSAIRLLACLASAVAPPFGHALADTAPQQSTLAAIDVPSACTAHVEEAAKASGLPARWIEALMGIESGGDARAVSPAGAMGCMQIMPATWAELRLRLGLGADPFDPRDNMLAGVAYARDLLHRFGAPGFVAAYNAGPARYENHLATGRPLPLETRMFIAALAPAIMGGHVIDVPTAPAWATSPLFTGRWQGDADADRSGSGRQRHRLAELRPSADPQIANLLFTRRPATTGTE